MFFENFDKLCAGINTTPTAFVKDVLGLSTSKVTAWKNGSIPKYEILQQIADVFNVTVGQLFDGTWDENEKNAPVDTDESVLLQHLQKTYSDNDIDILTYLNRNQAAEIVEQAKKMKSKQ
jgi:transcriptional regulator with XRE-family HTH domain